jgi:hypothetical protein
MQESIVARPCHLGHRLALVLESDAHLPVAPRREAHALLHEYRHLDPPRAQERGRSKNAEHDRALRAAQPQHATIRLNTLGRQYPHEAEHAR